MDNRSIELQAKTRTITGKRARHLRREGQVPGHVYGHKETLNVQVDARALREVLNKGGDNVLVTLRLDEGSRTVMLRSVTRHNLSKEPLNVDFQEVALDEPIRAQVPLVVTGEPANRSANAMILRLVEHLNVEALPAAVPHSISVDVSHLASDDEQIRVRDLQIPPGVTVLDDPDEPVAKLDIVRVPTEEEAPAPVIAEGEEVAEGPEEAEGKQESSKETQ
ncbi:MAG: 50S ribosomal protein L25 [Chloroflexota bacterium]